VRIHHRAGRSGFLFFSFFLISAVAYGQAVESKGAKTFLWKIQSQTAKVYLLGSIHLLKKDFYPLNPKIEEAFDQSELIAVEANLSGSRQLDLQKLMDRALYGEDDSLEKHVSPETFDLIRQKAVSWGLPMPLIAKQKPWFLGLMFTSVEFLRLGYDPAHGIDQYFLTKASDRKKILEMEGLDEQINLLSNMSDPDQELFILLALKDAATRSREVEAIVRAWNTGDVPGIERILTKNVREDQRLASMYRILIDDRNKRMASTVEEFLKTRGTYFVILGAGHLVGENGIVGILRKNGYTVEQM